MAIWKAPESIEKGINVSSLSDDELRRYHDEMHIFWERILEGIWFEWTFREVYDLHRDVVLEMIKREIRHLQPINTLDDIEFAEDVKELAILINKVKKKPKFRKQKV